MGIVCLSEVKRKGLSIIVDCRGAIHRAPGVNFSKGQMEKESSNRCRDFHVLRLKWLVARIDGVIHESPYIGMGPD